MKTDTYLTATVPAGATTGYITVTTPSGVLNVAVEAIQALQEGDRMIAVISHVTDLAERLPSRIQVIKGISGSEIRMKQESTGSS